MVTVVTDVVVRDEGINSGALRQTPVVRKKFRDRLTLTLPVLNPNAKLLTSLANDVYVLVI